LSGAILLHHDEALAVQAARAQGDEALVRITTDAVEGETVNIYVDADACPVKEEISRVARRHGIKVTLVTNARMRIPPDPDLTLVVVDGRFDSADDWIAGHVARNDIVVSADIPLASRCLKEGARVLAPTGRIFTADSIGDALATRAISAHLRELGAITGGPAAFGKRDRSRFLERLDEVIQAALRAG
jgi:uncharacterized protein YaiI (UPF0178 family)